MPLGFAVPISLFYPEGMNRIYHQRIARRVELLESDR